MASFPLFSFRDFFIIVDVDLSTTLHHRKDSFLDNMSTQHQLNMALEAGIDKLELSNGTHQEQPEPLDTLLAQVKGLAAESDNAGRIKVLEKLRDLSYSIETSEDTAKRLLYNVMSP